MMRIYDKLCIVAAFMLIAGCVVFQPIPDYTGLPEDLAPIYDQSLTEISQAAIGRRQCRANCTEKYEGQINQLKTCNELCDCLHENQELAPSWHRYIVCADRIIDRVLAN